MAYRFFEADVLTSRARVLQAVRSAPSADFGAVEALAVWLGMRDEPATLHAHGRVSTWFRELLGLGPKRPLADERLECIRRVTVSLKHGLRPQAAEEIESARRAGVTEAQIAALEARFHGTEPKRTDSTSALKA